MSRVLNDKPGVSPETRQAVLTALDVLGYERPARLRKRSAGLVGLVVPELDNPIFPAFAQVIESVLAQSGYTPVLCTADPGRGHRGRVRRDAARPAGQRHRLRLRAARRHHRRPRPLPQAGRPQAADRAHHGLRAPASRRRSSPATTAPPPSWPCRTWSRSATGGSASSPARSGSCPCSASSPDSGPTMTRLLGTTSAELDSLVSLSLFGVEGGAAAAGRLLDRGVTGIVCGSDLMALGRDPRGAVPRTAGARRRLGRRLRRLAADRLHRPAADDAAASRCRPWPSPASGRSSTRSTATPRRTRSTCSAPSSSSVARPPTRRSPRRSPRRPRRGRRTATNQSAGRSRKSHLATAAPAPSEG